MILITGSNGQLGSELRNLLDSRDISYVATTTKELDITDKDLVSRYVKELNPSVIYHCAAYTAVDNAEDVGREDNHKVNAEGTRNLALAAKECGATFVYISTDYVFDGTSETEYLPEDKTNPQNEYGRAKLEGENAVRELLEKYYIIRTSWVFGEHGNNFVYTMQRLAKDRDRLTIVADQFGRPTWTKTLAEFMVYSVENNVEYGTYHLSNDNSCSWYEFAKEILKDEEVEVVPIESKDFPQKANRPKYSIMNLEKTKKTGFEIPTWQEALENFLNSAEK